MPVLVTPQAVSLLRPTTTTGMPGMVAPMTLNPGAERWARYQVVGAVSLRWGSLARIGFPFVERHPATTQLLEPTSAGGGGGRAARVRSSTPSSRAASQGGGAAASLLQSVATCSGLRRLSSLARIASSAALPASCIAIIWMAIMESLGRQGSGVWRSNASSMANGPS